MEPNYTPEQLKRWSRRNHFFCQLMTGETLDKLCPKDADLLTAALNRQNLAHDEALAVAAEIVKGLPKVTTETNEKPA